MSGNIGQSIQGVAQQAAGPLQSQMQQAPIVGGTQSINTSGPQLPESMSADVNVGGILHNAFKAAQDSRMASTPSQVSTSVNPAAPQPVGGK